MLEARLGIIPRLGGTVRLARVIERTVVAEMMFITGRILDAEEALRIGLVNLVVPPDQIMRVAFEFANGICKRRPLAVRAIKKSIEPTEAMSMEEALWWENALALPL